MAEIITLKIDVTKIDKARLFKGAKGTYLDLVLIPTPGGQYGDYMIKQSVTKEERAQNVQLPILGNGKCFGGQKATAPAQQAGRSRTAPAAAPAKVVAGDEPPESDDVPF